MSAHGTTGHPRTARRPVHRASRLWAGLAAAGFVLAACGGGDTGGGTGSGGGGGGGGTDGPVTLTFVNAQDPGTFDEVIAGFKEVNPDITIEQQVVPFDDLNTTVQSRLQAKDAGIDLYDVDEPRLASFAARGFLADLSDIADEAEGTVDEKALEATQYDGKQYAMPRWTSTQLLYYNKGLLQQAGVPAPGTDPAQRMTWEALTAAGEKAQAAGAEWGLTFEQVDRYYQLQPLPESLGGGPGLQGDGLLEPDVTNEEWVKAFTWYASTFESGLSPRGITAEQTQPLFSQGGTAFFVGGPWNAPLFDEAKVDYGVAPFPVFEGGEPASSTGSWSTGVSPFSENQDAAKEFIAYMTTDPTGAWEVNSRNIPVQQDAFQKYLTTTRDRGGNAAQLATIVEQELETGAVSRPTTTGFVDFEAVMNEAFADIRNGSDVEERLQDASDELDRTLEKYRR